MPTGLPQRRSNSSNSSLRNIIVLIAVALGIGLMVFGAYLAREASAVDRDSTVIGDEDGT
jgi:hypothetical protein